MKTSRTLFALSLAAVAGLVATGCHKPNPPSVARGPSSNTTLTAEAPEEPATPAAETPAATSDAAAPATTAPAETNAEDKPAAEAPASEPAKPAEPAKEPGKPAEPTSEPTPEKPADEQKPTEPAKPAEPTASAEVSPNPTADVPVDKTANATIQPGDWNQWGGTSYRNNTPIGVNIPMVWDIGGTDRKTKQKMPPQNIKWSAQLGSQTYGNPVVVGGRVFVGTNNSAGWLKRYPSAEDLGCLLAFNDNDGSFLWQDSSEKLPTGRVHDWPMQGICCAPLVEGDRLWYVTSRGEVKCLDPAGFHDDEDDGEVQSGMARIVDIARQEDPATDPVAPAIKELDAATLPAVVREQMVTRGVALPPEVMVAVDEAGSKWTLTAKLGDADRTFKLSIIGPKLSVFKVITTDDKEEADVIWSYDMMDKQKVSQHNMCSCSLTSLGDILFVCTSNGVDESHIKIPQPDAPSFMAMDKTTGEVYWTDKSPGLNIHHGQWSSPTVAKLGGVDQVLFGGGDGWLYSFQADKGVDGKPTLLWKFDTNPKDAELILGGRGTRNDIIATPVVYDGLVYVAVGQDPEHGEGPGHLWCVDPTKRGDVSPWLAMKVVDGQRVEIPHRRFQAVIPEEGDVAVDNPNSAVVWHYAEFDVNGNGEIEFEETMHRSCGTVAIQDDLLFISDFSGLFHCLDAKTGKVHWTYDMLAAAWGSPLIVEKHVYIGDEDGDIAVFNLSADPKQAMKEVEGEWVPVNAYEEDTYNRKAGDVAYMENSVYTTPIVANNVLYIANKDHLFAIQAPPPAAE